MSLNDRGSSSELQNAIELYQNKRTHQAIALLNEEKHRFSSSTKFWIYLGFLYKETGQLDAAVVCFRKAVRLSPRSEKASLALFHALWRKKHPDVAFEEMRRFIGAGEPKDYLALLRDMLSRSLAQVRAPEPTDLSASELREAEQVYLRAERNPNEPLTEVVDETNIMDLVHA
jgi:tetratricopeptide (TPR) repeat protein